MNVFLCPLYISHQRSETWDGSPKPNIKSILFYQYKIKILNFTVSNLIGTLLSHIVLQKKKERINR